MSVSGSAADELFSGMSSNLFERVREQKSLAYFVRSSRIVGLDTGMFYFFAGTSPQRYGEVIAGVKDSGGDLGFTEDLLRRFSELAIYTGTEIHLPQATLAASDIEDHDVTLNGRQVAL